MASLNTSLFTYLFLLLSLFNVSLSSAIVPRQSPSANTNTASTNCLDYSRIANLTTISVNSTYRAAFLRSAPMGTFRAISIIDQDAKKLMPLMMDGKLNGQCGNLSTIAFQAAATNFTQGTVLGFKILEAVGADPAGFAMPFCWVLISLMMTCLWISL